MSMQQRSKQRRREPEIEEEVKFPYTYVDEPVVEEVKPKRAEIPKTESTEISQPEQDSSVVLVRAVTHPLTFVPLIIFCLLFVYALLFAPFFGGFIVSFFASLGTGAFGALHGWWRFLRGRREYEQEVADRAEQRVRQDEEAERQKTEENISVLKSGFGDILRNSKEPITRSTAQMALNELRDLQRGYGAVSEEVEQAVKNNRFSLDISARIEPLAKKIYGEGLLLLINVLDLIKVVSPEDEKRLLDEIASFEQDIANPKGRSREVLEMKKKSLDSKRTRLDKIKNNRESIDVLLCRADECDNTLRAAHDDLIKMRIESSEGALGDVLKRLQDCLKIAVEVRRQLREEGLSV